MLRKFIKANLIFSIVGFFSTAIFGYWIAMGIFFFNFIIGIKILHVHADTIRGNPYTISNVVYPREKKNRRI